MAESKSFDTWLKTTAVSLTGKVILHRSSLSPKDIAQIRSRGSWHPPASGNLENAALLEVGGEILAEGKIIQQKDGSVFQVARVFGNQTGEKS